MVASKYEDPTTWRLRSAGGIPIRLVERSGSFTSEDADAEEVYLVRASQLFSFILEVFPAPIPFGQSVLYPALRRFPGSFGPILKVKEASWESNVPGMPIDPFIADPLAPDGTYHPIVRLTLKYGTVKDEDEDDDESDPNDPDSFLRVTGRAAGEYIHSQAPGAKWQKKSIPDLDQPQSDEFGNPINPDEKEQGQAPNVPATILVPETEWTVTWSRIPLTVFRNQIVSRLRSRLGKVNSEVMPLLHGAKKETILFAGYDFDEQYTWRTDTQPPVRLSLKFLEKRVESPIGVIGGHNHFYRPGKGWERLLVNGEDPAFRSADMNGIWTP